MIDLSSLVIPESCDGCGHCCLGIGSPPLVYQSLPDPQQLHPLRPADLPQELIAEIDARFLGLVRGQESQDVCLWYDRAARRCRHYEWRPQICRDYEIGGSACLATRAIAAMPASLASEGRERSSASGNASRQQPDGSK